MQEPADLSDNIFMKYFYPFLHNNRKDHEEPHLENIDDRNTRSPNPNVTTVIIKSANRRQHASVVAHSQTLGQ